MIVPEYEHLWKTFGASTAAGKLLREIYDPSAHERIAKRISYPELQSKSCKVVETLPKIQRPKVATPKFRKSVEPESTASYTACKRPASKILAEMAASANDRKPPVFLPVDREIERRRVQERFQFSRATCIPQSVDVTRPTARSTAEQPERISERDSLLRDLIKQVKDDQNTLEGWAEDVSSLKLRGSVNARQKILSDKLVEQLRLKNKITETIRDIKTIIDLDNYLLFF